MGRLPTRFRAYRRPLGNHRPVPRQVIHKHTGLFARSVEGTGYQIRYLLSNPLIAQRLGELGYEPVRENFLNTTNAKRYLTLFLHLLGHG